MWNFFFLIRELRDFKILLSGLHESYNDIVQIESLVEGEITREMRLTFSFDQIIGN